MEEKKSFGFFLPLLIIVVLLVLGYFFLGKAPMDERGIGKKEEVKVTEQTENNSSAPMPVASGNIDESAAAIILGASQDPSLSDQDTGDAALVTIDNDTIISYGQAYDETGI